MAHRLQSRMDELSDRYPQTWTAPLPPFVRSCRFQRGFVELVALEADSLLRNGPRIFRLAPVRHMHLPCVRNVGGELFSSPSLSRLKSLAMDDCGLYIFHVRLLAASGALHVAFHITDHADATDPRGANGCLPGSAMRHLSRQFGGISVKRACPPASSRSISNPAFGQRPISESLRSAT